MKSRRLGKTALTVSEICMGTMTLGSMADEKTSLQILDRADEAGVDFFDTAEIYPVPPDQKHWGRSEEILGKWLEGRRRDSVFVATKAAGPTGGWFRAPVRGGLTGLDRHAIESALEGSLKRLKTDYIDLYQTHWPDPELPLEVTMEALDRLVQSGKVRYVGCSNQNAYGLTKSLWTSDLNGFARYETIQNNFSLLNRRFSDELAAVCRAEQVSLLPYSPIAGGVLSGKYLNGEFPEGARFSRYRDNDARTKAMTARFINPKTLASTERYAKIASDAGMSVAKLAVAWSLAHDFVGSTIIGATHTEQLEDTLSAGDVKLSDEVLLACDQVERQELYPLG
ncbi:MAG: aldo/keto reductase [bacterium]|nr:aldo/keto reductase [bacterium]